MTTSHSERLAEPSERSRSLNVLLVSSVPPPFGGIATFTKHLLAESATSAEVEIIFVDSSIRWRRVTQQGLIRRVVGGTLQALSVVWRVRREVTHRRPDVAQISSAGGLGFVRDYLLMRYLRSQGIPAVLWFANNSLPSRIGAGGIGSRIALAVLRRASSVVVLDEPTYKFLSVYSWLDVHRLPVFIRTTDLESAPGTPDPGVDLLYAGWLLPEKGVPELVRSCAQLGNVRLRLVGPVEKEFAVELNRLAAGSPVEILGVVSDRSLFESMAGAKALILPSHAEGSPLVVLEAMALGKPVIATRVGAIAELLHFDSPEPCGLEVPVGDVAALGEAIRILLDNEQLRTTMGGRGRERVERCYSSRSVFPLFVHLWRSLAERES